MSKKQNKNVEMTVFKTKISILTDEPVEMLILADELNKQLDTLANQYPGTPPNLILTLECLKLLEENKKMKNENTSFSKERDKIEMTLRDFFGSN